MKLKISYLFVFIFVLIRLDVHSQAIWKLEKHITSDIETVETDSFTAFTFQLPIHNQSQFNISINGKIEKLLLDEHVENTLFNQSILYVFNGNKLQVLGAKGLNITIIFQKVDALNLINSSKLNYNRRTFCEQPNAILPAVWRQGLADPKPNPISTNTLHGIIHHSASGNGNTDYTSLVRNYYVQHTQVNGWDDIGYNYLVAYNGDIYIGRDKQNLMVQNYKVQGAHFCAKNTSTFGTCLIGNFSDIRPSDTMLASLYQLFSWVFYTEQLSALDSAPHPTFSDPFLSNIAGHRQGCSTECPGDSTFLIIQHIRDSIQNRILACGFFVEMEVIGKQENVISYFDNQIIINAEMEENLDIFNAIGVLEKRLSIKKGQTNHINLSFLPSGIYIAILPSGRFIRFLKA